MTETPTHTPLPYECFRDASYYDMWFVRRVNEREWGKGFHLVNGDEAAALRDLLNTRADSHHDLIEALEALSAEVMLLRIAVQTDDPKREVMLRISDIDKAISAILTKEAGQ